MKTFLVGYSGFVGSNIASSYKFDGLFNSKNIEDAFEAEPDILVYSGVPAEMFSANADPDTDLKIIKNAIRNIKKIKPAKLVLISTVAVYDRLTDVDEDAYTDKNRLSAYGRNRLYLEEWVRENLKSPLIVRLPALYGQNLRKNFIYDYIHFIPKLLKEEKYLELKSRDEAVTSYYLKLNNGFYGCKDLSPRERNILTEYFQKAGFSALNFTDSRNVYQFLNLNRLWQIIQKAMENGIEILNAVTEPVSVTELYRYLENSEFNNLTEGKVLQYNLKTKYSAVFGGKDGYLLGKDDVLSDIKRFVTREREKLNGGSR